jgi:hypothetical protein
MSENNLFSFSLDLRLYSEANIEFRYFISKLLRKIK